LRAWITLLATLAVALTFAATAWALPARFWGVVPQAGPTLEQDQRLARGGVESIRMPFSWAAVQAVPGGAYDWTGLDNQVENASQAGIEVFPFLSGAPSWAVPLAFVPGTGHRSETNAHLPVSGSAAGGWLAFVRTAVARYGPEGAFWLEHPNLPQMPIRNWQVWNEANFKYFVARPNPKEFGKLVKITSNAIKGVDHGAKVILGGLFARPREALFKRKPKQAYFATDFLRIMYRTTPGIKTRFDGVALHPYTTRWQLLTPEIEEVRDVLREAGDAGVGLWITELGWSSERPTPRNSFAKGAHGQVTQLKGAFRLLKSHAAKWRIKRVYWFSVDDQKGTCNFCDGSGLFRDGFIPKPSWKAYVHFAGGRP
jgi:hypothetical protein